MTPETDARPDAFPPGDARWARHCPEMPAPYRLAVWHGEGRTLFYVMKWEGEYWEPQASFASRQRAVDWARMGKVIG